MTELDKLWEDVCADPENWRLRQVLADHYEDHGLPKEAEWLRWMARHQKRPQVARVSMRAYWFHAEAMNSDAGDPQSDLPGVLYFRLKAGKVSANHHEYESAIEAEWDAMAACLTLPHPPVVKEAV